MRNSKYLPRVLVLGLSLLCVLVFISPCLAKEFNFEASVDKNKVPLGGSLRLSLSFNGVQDMPAPELPQIDGFKFRYLGPSTMMSIVNGKVSGSITHNYLLLPVKIGTFKIGPFKLDHKGDKYTSNQLSVQVLQSQAQVPAQSAAGAEQPPAQVKDLDDRLFITLQTEKSSAYLNEEVPLTVKLYVNRLGIKDIQYPELSHEGFSLGAFDKPSQYQELYRGVNFDVIEFKTSVFGLKPGEFKLGPAHIKCNLLVRNQAKRGMLFGSGDPFDSGIFDNFFGRYEVYPLDLKSGEAGFNVLPLPQENKPAGFSGALGDFSFRAEASPLEVKLGDPVTLKMTIKGEGNFSTVSAPRLSSTDGFKVYEPQVKQENNEKRFEQIIMPMSAQVREIPVLTFDFFDTVSGEYKSIKRGPFPIKITKPEKEEESRIVEGRQSPAFAREEKLGRDIIYIKDTPGVLRKKGDYLYKNKVFLTFQLFPLLLYLGIAFVLAKSHKLRTDVRYARGLLAPRKAKAGILQANKYLDKGEVEKFYDTLFVTMQEYLGNKFHLSSKGITISIIDEYLRKTGVTEEILYKLKDIFRECDMVRYASSQLSPQNMRDSLLKLEEVIDYLQKRKI
ncbi:MAG: BatD family protein [Candidatus Omnitrophica bacterium]|nr:BatD family protein [Candidatus Omnitrophota bacterium]